MSTPADLLLAKLEGVKRTPNGWSAKCPAHTDRTPTLSVRQRDDGVLLVNCFAGCGAVAVLDAVGLSLSDLYPKALGHHIPHEKRPFAATDVVRLMAAEAMVAATILWRVIDGQELSEDHKQRGALAAWRLLCAHDTALPNRDRRQEYRAAAAIAADSCG